MMSREVFLLEKRLAGHDEWEVEERLWSDDGLANERLAAQLTEANGGESKFRSVRYVPEDEVEALRNDLAAARDLIAKLQADLAYAWSLVNVTPAGER